MSSKFGQIGPCIAELAAFKRLETFPWTYNRGIVVTTLALSFLNGKDNYKSLDEFVFRPDPITDYEVSCP